MIPTNIISPFIENNFPQLLVLGVVMGTALLLLDKKREPDFDIPVLFHSDR